MLRYLKSLDRVIYIDPKGGEYRFGVECVDAADIHDLTDGPNKKFCVRVPTRELYWLHRLCEQAIAVSEHGPVYVAIDEIQYFSSSYDKPVEGFADLLAIGPMRGVSLIGTTHRPTDIHSDFLAAADLLFIYQTHHQKDIQRLQHYAAIPDEAFMELKQDQCIIWRADTPGYKIEGEQTEEIVASSEPSEAAVSSEKGGEDDV